MYGTRYLSAQYGSCMRGVIVTGVVNSDSLPYYFLRGKSYEAVG